MVTKKEKSPMRERVARLSPRQRQVVRLTSLGCSTAETAAMRLLGTDKAALVTRIAVQHGLAPLDDMLSKTEQRRSGRRRDGWN